MLHLPKVSNSRVIDSKSGSAYEFECEFLGTTAMKNMRKCHGVKMCSHSAEELNSRF